MQSLQVSAHVGETREVALHDATGEVVSLDRLSESAHRLQAGTELMVGQEVVCEIGTNKLISLL